MPEQEAAVKGFAAYFRLACEVRAFFEILPFGLRLDIPQVSFVSVQV
ncbi:hypothetical protein [Paenibacillus eucommiae]|uniref:Uncharacterized protein n=1 Tax=Paenibacillus eucommiae TaxID=1355755 RepID=A0ABS4J0B2_9BACL|nr:hypothetical protein [Paenibacillus eucommiae]MBP1993282.1 hypothetical protein [Paenibacillus eucommiae]